MTLFRTGKLKDRIAINGETDPIGKVITNVKDYKVLLPVPLTVIDLNNDAELKPNTGYN